MTGHVVAVLLTLGYLVLIGLIRHHYKRVDARRAAHLDAIRRERLRAIRRGTL